MTRSHLLAKVVHVRLERLFDPLIVCHCYREKDALIRIVSARKADRTEQARHEGRRRR